METDVRALVDKLVKVVEYKFKVEQATALLFSEANAIALVSAEARVESAKATLMALVKAATRKG
jgi:hypothetical protein